MRRPGLWVANGHPGNPAQMLSWRPGALTCFFDYLGPNGILGYKAANPDAPIIVRFQHPFNWQQDPVGFARRLGEQVASKWNDLKALDPYVYFANEMNLHYENGDQNPGNQPLYTTPEFYQKYAQWVRMTADTIKSRVPEMKLVTPPFAFGHREDGSPDDNGQPTEGWAGYDYLYETVRDYFNNIICFHAYWGHAGGSERTWLYDPALSSWYALRWRRVLKLFEARYQLKAKVIIDEAGNFGAADPDFTDQVMYYAQQCLSDARVIALTYFLWLDPTNSPGNLPNSWAQRVPNLPDHLNRLKAMPDVSITTGETPGPEPTIRVLLNDGSVKPMLLEEYLRAVVPAEIPALWPAEVVKAQAVASRTYAQYAIEHPRHPNADVCANPAHCQNFDPTKIYPNADEAIQQTKGLIARYNGATANTVFSANCGGHTFNNEDVFQGTPEPYLRGVACPDPGPKNGHGVGLCQYGARTFASQGQPYDAIIKHYYTGVTIGPVTTVRTSTIVGLISSQTGQPAANIRLKLTGAGQLVETTSRADGTYRFSNVPTGTYTLELPDYNVRQTNLSPAAGQDLTVNFTLPAVPQPSIVADAVRGPGLPLLVGNWLQAKTPIRITPPDGPPVSVISGSKPEYGPGGFEIYATQTGTYVLEMAGYRFDIPMNGQFTRLTFRQTGAVVPLGIIEGTLLDYQNRPVADWFVYLTGNGANSTTTTNAQGYFTFANLAAGSYTVAVAESNLSQTVASDGQGKVTLALQLPAPEQQVRLVSVLLPRARAETLRVELEADTDTRGVFTIQGV